MQIWLIWFLNAALGLRECLASRPGRFTSKKGPTVTIGGESGWTPGRSRRCEDDNLFCCWESNQISCFVQPVAWLLHGLNNSRPDACLLQVFFSYACESEAVSETRQCVDLWDALCTCLRIGMLSWRWYSNGRFLSRYSTRQTDMWKEKFPQVGRALFMPL